MSTLKEDLFEGWLVWKDGMYVTAFLDSYTKWEEDIDIEEVPFIQHQINSMGLNKFYTDEELLSLKTFSFVRHSMQAIGVNTNRHRLHLEESGESYTDGKKIVVSTKPLEDKIHFPGALGAIDVVVGLGIHEGCHILYTNFKRYTEYLRTEKFLKNELFKKLSNILEDERIERELCKVLPGNGNYLAKVKEYYFSLHRSKAAFKTDKDIESFMNLFLQIIRYPKYVKDDMVDLYADLLFDIKDVLVPYPDDYEICLQKTREVYELIIKYFEIDPEDAEGEGDGEGSEALSEAMKGFSESLGELLKEMSEEDGEGEGKGVSGEPPSGSGKTDPVEKSSWEEILDGDVTASSEGVKYKAKKSEVVSYLDLVSEIKPYIAGFKHFLFYNTNIRNRKLQGLRSGTLDTTKLVEGIQGSQTIYTQNRQTSRDRLTVALLLDNSGSMWGERIENARKVAILMCEVFSSNKDADLYIYGYTAQNKTETQPELIEFYTPKNRNKTSLVNMESLSQNMDGYSLLHVRKEIRKHTNSEVLLFMVSDGQPSGHGYSGLSAIQHTGESVKVLEKDNFKIIHIAIQTEGLPDVYDNIVKLDDMTNLAPDITSIVKRNIL